MKDLNMRVVVGDEPLEEILTRLEGAIETIRDCATSLKPIVLVADKKVCERVDKENPGSGN